MDRRKPGEEPHRVLGDLQARDPVAGAILRDIGFGRSWHEFETVGGEPVGAVVDIVGTDRDVLDAFAPVFAQILLDLTGVVLGFVERDADLAAGGSDGAADEAGDATIDV